MPLGDPLRLEVLRSIEFAGDRLAAHSPSERELQVVARRILGNVAIDSDCIAIDTSGEVASHEVPLMDTGQPAAFLLDGERMLRAARYELDANVPDACQIGGGRLRRLLLPGGTRFGQDLVNAIAHNLVVSRLHHRRVD